MIRPRPSTVALAVLFLLGSSPASARQYDSSLFAGLHYRMIGPFRGGRTVSATGVPGHPNEFYIGVNDGGVWKSTDYGRLWNPVFDAQSTGSIGAIAVAPSDPNTVYVGSGEGLQRPDLSVGDGIYKSIDGGKTWRHLGLTDGLQIPAIIVDPRDPNRLFVAVLGHPYGPNIERGIYRSTDGGESWQKVLYKDENTGGMDLAFDPSSPQTVFAVLWSARQSPWEIGSSFTLSANNGLYKSTDGGTTWRQITAGLPSARDGLGRIGLGVSPSAPARMYAVVGASVGGGLYRSDDGGESWHLQNADGRLWGRDGDFNEVKVDPRNADVVYIANVVTWKSTDGGTRFTGWRGAPGGDDYHRLWINPDDPDIIIIAADQGAIVTVNGGISWSSWYNQPTAQFYHVIADNAFPYTVYGGQQESGSAGISSRGNDGGITFREWHPVGAEEYGYIAPDPLDPNIVYGGKVSRYDRRTGQVQNVSPEALRSGRHRFVRTMPLLFSPLDPHILYLGSNVVFKTSNGGTSWQTISPDLTREHYEVPASLGAFAALDPEHGKHRGVVYAIAPSFRKLTLLWAGTDDGLIWVTHNGGAKWRNVTPPPLIPWSKVAQMEASHYDTLEAFAAINRIRLDDLHPHIYRTRNDGKSWTEIVSGIPDNEVVNTVREDPVRRGLLFAGTQKTVYVSFDDGDRWQPLRLNLPGSSVRDLSIHDADLLVATHGRSFWILDDITPLRQMKASTAESAAVLFQPAPAWRVRWNQYTDTPLPPDEPAGENPPDGAIIDYFVGTGADEPVTSDTVTLEIRDGAGHLVRRFSNHDALQPVDSSVNIPLYWVRPSRVLDGTRGMHRFVWDLHLPAPATLQREYPISATVHDTPLEPRGPWAPPGRYTVTLTVGDHISTQPLVVRMDPRVKATPLELNRQFALSQRLAAILLRDSTTLGDVRGLRTQLGALRARASDSLRNRIDSLDASAATLERGTSSSDDANDNLSRLNGELAGVYGNIQGADRMPTLSTIAAVNELERRLGEMVRWWEVLRHQQVADLNARLRAANLPELSRMNGTPTEEDITRAEDAVGEQEP